MGDNMEKKEVVKNVLIYIMKIFWVFIIGSVIGYILETIVGFVQNGHFVSRKGLLYGPFIQVYGIGLILYYFLVPKIKGDFKVFALSMLLGGIIEYLCSYFQEILFGTVSWDYSNLLFNINGRTSLLHCLYWGIGGILFMKFVYPHIKRIEEYLKNSYFRFATYLLIIFMAFNISISTLAAFRQDERRNNISPSDAFDNFLDTYYSDEVMDRVYENKKEIV